MSIFRAFGKVALLLVALVDLVGLYFAVAQGNWWMVFICTGFLVVLASFYDVFRIEALREKHPHGSFAPSKKIIGLLLFFVGVGMTVGGAARLFALSPISGAVLIAVGLFVLWGALDVFRGRT